MSGRYERIYAAVRRIPRGLIVTIAAQTPGEVKSGGRGLRLRWGFHDTPFGTALVATTPRGVCHLAFVDGGRQAALAALKKRWPRALIEEDAAGTGAVLAKAFRGRGRVPVTLAGTPFQTKVWEALLRIPFGRTASYAQVAAAIGNPRATRAVGTAVGANPVAFLIPCHRVLRSTGALGGYRWGTGRKRAIVAWEASKRVS